MIRGLFALTALCTAAGCVMVVPIGTRQFPQQLTGVGTEPFWNLSVNGKQLGYRDIEMPQERTIAVSRQASANQLVLTGTLDGRPLRATFSAGQCSDGMSDRKYPYALTLNLGERTLNGCAY